MTFNYKESSVSIILVIELQVDLNDSSEGAYVHICQRQMCLPAPDSAHAHICQKQMCLFTLNNLFYFKIFI